ncbi:hypothetical protein MMC12_000700 [Toensbergia leucococca]|nr:hypothetical protein [Toensbergia leucococca]
MQRPSRHALTAAVFLLFTYPIQIQAQAVSSETIRTRSSSSSGHSICPSRSINYITQTLPQQCLRTTWTNKPDDPSLAGIQSASTIVVSSSPSLESAEAILNSTTKAGQQSGSVSSVSSIAHGSTTTPPQSTSASGSISRETISQAQSTLEIEPESEGDSPLDNVNFLSFDEWKKQNLAKAGQSLENVGDRRTGAGDSEHRRRPGNIHNALDSLGEDVELDINFGGFVSSGAAPHTPSSGERDINGGSSQPSGEGSGGENEGEVSGTHSRSKDAGKTCKERFNYASFDCAATVLKTNAECKGSTSILVENKDSYMLNECSANNKFFIIELCNDILIDTVVLANFEFFSSMFRTFRVSVSDRYPVKLEKWRVLGTYEARNSRDVQPFLIESPQIWARYLRIEFLTHYGNEYYCPVSLLRIHGKTMYEEFKNDVKGSRGEEDSEDESSEEVFDGSGDSRSEVSPAHDSMEEAKNTSMRTVSIPDASPTASLVVAVPVSSSISSDAPGSSAFSHRLEASTTNVSPFDSPLNAQIIVLSSLSSHDLVCTPESATIVAASIQSISMLSTQSVKIPSASDQPLVSSTAQKSIQSNQPSAANGTNPTISSIAIVPSISSSSMVSGNKTNSSIPTTPPSQATARLSPSSTHPQPAAPTTQESFFKTVHKRLQLLELNATLSLQYIEDQSRILRDAFSKVEKRQLAKTTSFLDLLNSTVLNELRDFRSQYDQIWQSTVLELSSQREQSQHEVLALTTRLSLLADEILFQKRMAIGQSILILLCLGLVIFSRSSTGLSYLDLPPLVQNIVQQKNHSRASHYDVNSDSPQTSPSRPPSRRRFFGSSTHARSPSDESTLNDSTPKSPTFAYSPPTPTSQLSMETGGRRSTSPDYSDDSPVAGGDGRMVRSSPPTPSGGRPGRNALEGREEGLLRPGEGVLGKGV